MKRQKPILLIIIVVALVASLLLRQRNYRNGSDRQSRREESSASRSQSDPGLSERRAPADQSGDRSSEARERSNSGSSGSSGGLEFDRTLKRIVYTKHARCRMGCRKIDESEILEIRDEGRVNYEKSELKSGPDPKFAVEGMTHDKQFVRVVFAQTANSLVVVTCIDLDTDWACSCN